MTGLVRKSILALSFAAATVGGIYGLKRMEEADRVAKETACEQTFETRRQYVKNAMPLPVNKAMGVSACNFIVQAVGAR